MKNFNFKKIFKVLKNSIENIGSSPDKDWKFLERIGENIAKLYSVVDLSRSFTQIVSLFNNENAVIRRVSIFLLDSIIDLNLIKEDLIQVSTILKTSLLILMQQMIESL